MPTMRDNALRVKRFRELKTTLRTNRARLLVGLDIAQADHGRELAAIHGHGFCGAGPTVVGLPG